MSDMRTPDITYTAADVDLARGDQIQDYAGNWRTVICVTDAARPGRVEILDTTGLITYEWAADLIDFDDIAA